ncbi:hypothetical protein JCM11491_005957 [Sporobolomyces phaffii]
MLVSSLARTTLPLRTRPSRLAPSPSTSRRLEPPRSNRPSHRLVSTSPASASSGPSATAVFYRALVPSMLHCLALGSIVYYALELAYMTLEREQQVDTLGTRVRLLERELDHARTTSNRRRGGLDGDPSHDEAAQARRGPDTPWWKLW